MVDIDYVVGVMDRFIELFKLKYRYYNFGTIKKFRIDSRKNLEYDEDKWCELFLHKSCLNYCAKILLLKTFEDTGKITCKINNNGLEKWNIFVKNIKDRFDKLYDIAITDIMYEEENKWIADIFVESDYDIYAIDKDLATLLVKDLSNVSFENITDKDLVLIFRRLFPLDEREEYNLQEFYYRAPALDYILNLR